jgi:hypothetical protein
MYASKNENINEKKSQETEESSGAAQTRNIGFQFMNSCHVLGIYIL